MFYGVYKNSNGEISNRFYNSDEWDIFHRDTFSPDTETLSIIDLSVCGGTYQKRKAVLRDKAMAYQNLYGMGVEPSWFDLAIFSDFFTEQGKRYGLLTEFRQNGIL